MNAVVLVIIKNLIVNAFLVVIKVVSGLIFKSSALVADGVHSLSDLITDFASLFGEEIAKAKRGKKKIIFEDKTSILIGIIIIVLGILMVIQSFQTEDAVPERIVIYISIFVIIVKTIIVRYVSKMGKKLKNSILTSSAEESGADIITSIIALIAIIMSQFANHVPIFKYADLVGGLIIGVITLFVGLDIMIKNEKNIKKLSK